MISLIEILNMIVMTLAVAFIFRRGFGLDRVPWWKGMIFAAAVTAPGIILHELGHKVTALSFGLQATFGVPWLWLLFGVALAAMKSSFIFFVPAYVSIIGEATPLAHSLIAFMGPAINGLIWIACAVALKFQTRNNLGFALIVLTKRINGFLFLFNLLPIPPFDGFTVLYGLFQAFA